jgi:glycosyltransferase involved in cell wall biosynthesis
MFSIAMTTYNGERFLDGQLRSLSEPTLAPAELVVCDDGSTDQTVDILKRWAQRLPFPLRFFQNEQRLGSRRNFLKAASLCVSDYIAFCDQDDVWSKNKLATVASYL